MSVYEDADTGPTRIVCPTPLDLNAFR